LQYWGLNSGPTSPSVDKCSTTWATPTALKFFIYSR
jgi:hypothetical protein